MKLSVVVPCLNEAAVLSRLHAAIDAGIASDVSELEFVFVDDGSDDGTLSTVRDLATADARVRYVSLSRNFGKEAAMLAGLRTATGDAVVIMDADLQHPPELVPRMLALLDEGYDQVVASRTRTGDARLRTAMSRLYYRIINRLIEVPLVDGTGDFRLLSRRAVNALLALTEYNRFSKGLFAWIGFEQATVAYENVRRAEGDSRWSFRTLVNYGLDGVMSFNNKPLRLSIYMGITVTLLSLSYVAWLVARAVASGVDVPGYITLVAAVIGLGGIQLIFLGVIGEYIGRIYYETKRRPHYLVKQSNAPVATTLPQVVRHDDREHSAW